MNQLLFSIEKPLPISYRYISLTRTTTREQEEEEEEEEKRITQDLHHPQRDSTTGFYRLQTWAGWWRKVCQATPRFQKTLKRRCSSVSQSSSASPRERPQVSAGERRGRQSTVTIYCGPWRGWVLRNTWSLSRFICTSSERWRVRRLLEQEWLGSCCTLIIILMNIMIKGRESSCSTCMHLGWTCMVGWWWVINVIIKVKGIILIFMDLVVDPLVYKAWRPR